MIMNRKYWIIGLMAVPAMAAFGPLHGAEKLSLVAPGKPAAVIVTGSNPRETVANAASELQAYVEKSTGVRLPIQAEAGQGPAIHVGETPYVGNRGVKPPGLDHDGFVLRGFEDGNYVIVGGSDLGTEFGVYEFLERHLGVRWLMPGPDGEDVPKREALEVPLEESRQEPVFLSREYYKPSAGEEELWARRNRFHVRVEPGHNMLELFPVAEFGETRPDFYPLIDGKRQIPGPRIQNPKNLRERRNHRNWQPNFTAPGIVEVAAEKIDRYFEKNPEKSSFALGLNDGNDHFDQSEASLKRRSGQRNSMGYTDASDDYFLWANAVVEQVLGKHPDKWFGMLAYRALTDAPAYAGVNDRLVPYMTQDRLRWIDPQLRKADQDRTAKWAAVAKNLGWYDYTYGLGYLVPRVYPRLMGEYLAWAADHNVRFYYTEYNPNWGEGGKAWLLMRLLWNPKQDAAALMDEWHTRAGGLAAAPKLKEYDAIWEKFWTSDILKSKWWHGKGPYLSFANATYLQDVPLEYVEQSDRLLDEALALAETPAQKARVGAIREMWATWYKPHVLLSQMADKMGKIPQTEADALLALEDAEQSIALAQEFEGTVQRFSRDEAYRENPFFKTLSLRLGGGRMLWADGYGDMGFLLWRVEPWVSKSAKVRERLEALAATDRPVLRDNARALLAAGGGRGHSTIENPSFEEGDAGWTLEVETVLFPSDYPFPHSKGDTEGTFEIREKPVRSGGKSLEVRADHVAGTTSDIRTPARISQLFPYEPGFYYSRVSYYLPRTSPRTPPSKGRLRIEVLDEAGKVLPKAEVPPLDVTPIAGKWGRTSGVFTLPENAAARQVRVTLELTMLTPIGDFDPNQKIYIDDLDVVKVD